MKAFVRNGRCFLCARSDPGVKASQAGASMRSIMTSLTGDAKKDNQTIGTAEMLLACKYVITPIILLYRFRILIHDNYGKINKEL
ncbi:hypothetical protein ACTNES_02130 [Blautia sp. HCP3S3_D9]|uniref:hypothetical protein n=1 Tax=unclassified Blautia TaxID=2648079 RepID=UPI0025C41901|nr:hypothetical protein [Blautia sp.]MCI7449830.1 hypothetical protein [Blautia sp.]MDD6413729.1 hypothetical protein [Blautia sp.]MDD6446152.1 hypothetical protein [Lachnospiraceae bacterium]